MGGRAKEGASGGGASSRHELAARKRIIAAHCRLRDKTLSSPGKQPPQGDHFQGEQNAENTGPF